MKRMEFIIQTDVVDTSHQLVQRAMEDHMEGVEAYLRNGLEDELLSALGDRSAAHIALETVVRYFTSRALVTSITEVEE